MFICYTNVADFNYFCLFNFYDATYLKVLFISLQYILQVLFTHQKTKKAKTWQDGVLSVIDNKVG
jgi:hypothetical protein